LSFILNEVTIYKTKQKSHAIMSVRYLLLELLFVVALLQVSSIITVEVCGAFVVVASRRTHSSVGRLYSRPDDDGVDNNNAILLEKARVLREEAASMENDLRSSGSASSSSSDTSIPVPVVVVNTQLEDSIWTLSYRFSSQPITKDSSNNNNNNQEQQQQENIFYSGKINLRLKEDGYSEQIILNDDNNNYDGIEIIKIWGWDRETSNEDDLDYLLFSMDVKLPESDPTTTTTTKSNSKKNQIERYYFQARIDTEQESINNKNENNILVLKDGTITVKKDVTEKTNGRWGLFNVAGILTEFRYCGDFVAKPSS
jgi:hypothetical protein